MKYLIYISVLFFSYNCFSQVVFDKVSHDFGEINPEEIRFIDFKLTNTTTKKAYLLRVDPPSEVTFIQKGNALEKDSSIYLRFQVNPTKKGRFNYTVLVYTSDRDKPHKIKLTGSLLSDPQSSTQDFTQCPTFGSNPAGKNPLDFELFLKTIDQESNTPVPNSTVLIMQNGQALGKWKTDKNGILKIQIPLGITYFHASKNNYESNEVGQYVNFKRNEVTLPLKQIKSPENPIEIKEEEELLTVTPEIISDFLLRTATASTDSLPEINDTLPLSTLDPNDFNTAQFKPVHAVFIIDVSTSMSKADRLELMKHALISLTEMLREEDKIGIVSYASSPEVLLRPTKGNKKEQITPIIEKIKAGGFTDGGAGIRKGLRIARWNRNKEGVNHVFVISDGAFNRYSGNYKRWIKMSRRRGIKMSVVGVKAKEKDVERMQEIANLGGGSYIPLERLLDASQNIKQVVRKSAFKF